MQSVTLIVVGYLSLLCSALPPLEDFQVGRRRQSLAALAPKIMPLFMHVLALLYLAYFSTNYLENNLGSLTIGIVIIIITK